MLLLDLNFFTLFIWLVIAHVVGDYLLQSDFMARAKNHLTDVGRHMWMVVLPSHALIHGTLVLLVTGSYLCLLIETLTHTYIDYQKCDGKISFEKDQLYHIGVKVFIAFYWLIFM